MVYNAIFDSHKNLAVQKENISVFQGLEVEGRMVCHGVMELFCILIMMVLLESIHLSRFVELHTTKR